MKMTAEQFNALTNDGVDAHGVPRAGVDARIKQVLRDTANITDGFELDEAATAIEQIFQEALGIEE